VGAEAINLYIVFHLPQPPPLFYTEGDVVRALRGQGPTSRVDKNGGPHLQVHTESQPPVLDPEARTGFVRFRTLIAEDFGVTLNDVAVTTENGSPDRRGQRFMRDGDLHEESFLFSPFQLVIHTKSGQWLSVQPGERKTLSFFQLRLLLWFAVSTVALIPLAWFFARGLAKPMTQFANAAERFGRDPRAPPMVISGSTEIVQAAAAFNEMQDRLRRYVDDRTNMVAAIAHDLESVVDDLAETGADVTVGHTEKVVIDADSLALRRLLTNLLENALKYGVRARTRLSVSNGLAEIDVDDDGPGVPIPELNRVFDPFYRREPSRSRQTGGIGLGLSVARSIARAHGGDVTLLNRPQGGLTARVVLPV
jgi:two-component system OmpR family sensor kinase